MPLQLSQIDLSQAYQGSIANREVQKSFVKISSGKKLVNATDDTAAYAQSLRMESQQKRDSNNLHNLQNLISYSQAQESALKKAFKLTIINYPDKSIILDATHSNKKKRQIFIEIAQKESIPIRIIHLTTTIEEAMHRNLQRTNPVPKIALYLYRKNFEKPEKSEGLYEIINI